MRLLLVEDYAPVRETLEEGLREEGYAVDAVADGRNGLRYALDGAYDVIILDLMLPGLDGLSVLRELRRRECKTHVLVLTAKDTVRDRVTGLDLGADDYLIKPFAFAELLARVPLVLILMPMLLKLTGGHKSKAPAPTDTQPAEGNNGHR